MIGTLKPFDGQLLWCAVKKNLGIFFLMLLMGSLFLTIGVVVGFCLVEESGWGGLVFAAIFLISGGLLVVSFVSTISSISYYYGKALIKKHGINLAGELVKKSRNTTDWWNSVITAKGRNMSAPIT